MASTSSSSSSKPPKKVLFTASAATNDEGKILYTRFCKKGKECDRGDTCVFAHTYDTLNPVLCAHERGKTGCTRTKDCPFMHSTESKHQYVLRACREDLDRLGIDVNSISTTTSLKLGISHVTSENAAQQMKSAYTDLCEKAKRFKESWADIDEEEWKYEQSEAQLRVDPEFTNMKDYNSRTLYRLWGDGTFQVNRGDGVFVVVEKDGQTRHNIYDVLGSVSPKDTEDTDEKDEKKHDIKHSSSSSSSSSKKTKKHHKIKS